jgi:hypothetical protein
MTSNGTESNELNLTLCRVREPEISDEAMERWERLENKPAALEYDEKIDDGEKETFWNRSIPERKYKDDVRISRWRRWARNRGFEIPLKKLSGNDRLVLPEIFLTLNEDGQLKGFFPCSDGETGYSVEWILNCLEEGRDWEKWEDNPSTLSTKDPSRVHGAIKSHIKNNPEELLGEGWRYSEDEYVVGGFGGGGQIDLIFKHESETRYNLVEVKPSKETEKVDRAFGQLFRYRHSFVNDKISVGVGDVELTIAAPDFHDSHREAAEELGISLVHTPYAEPV